LTARLSDVSRDALSSDPSWAAGHWLNRSCSGDDRLEDVSKVDPDNFLAMELRREV